MGVTLAQSKTAVAPGITASFLASGGTAPYVYAVFPGGAGGTIDSSTGLYTAPANVPYDPAQSYDLLSATDLSGLIAYSKILVGNPLILITEILRREMDLPEDRVYLWQQKNFQPTDTGVYIAVSVVSCRPFSNVLKPGIVAGVPDWSRAIHTTNFYSVLDINIMSRDISALYRKEEVPLALNGIYARQQQEGNSFYIGKIPTEFNDLSFVDGAAIPYRFQISVAIQYAATKQTLSRYIDNFTAGTDEYYSP